MKLDLTIEGAQALRDFAEALEPVLDELSEDTDELIGVYDEVSEGIGPHEENFQSMLRTVKKAQITADEAVREMPPKMIALAQAIETFVKTKPSM